MKLIKKNSIPFFSIIFFLFFYFIDISIESTISATILIIVTLFLVTNKSSYEFEFRNIFGIKKFTYILIIFFTTILLQNHYLNFETIDFDIAAYLVTSQDIRQIIQSKTRSFFFVLAIIILSIKSNGFGVKCSCF